MARWLIADHERINRERRDKLQEVEVLHFEHRVLLFLFFPFIHDLAQLAGMPPAEGFLQGDEE